ncbi:MAG: hypothetical protein H6832_03625 [Planctomycetes bacterium]|nr:hypothetical protein [Planctomycetota bacterium]
MIVIGAGGRDLFDSYLGSMSVRGHVSDAGAARIASFAAWARHLIENEVVHLKRAGYEAQAVYPNDPRQTCFAQMAETAGLVIASPVVDLLLHPKFGPWVDVRAAIVVDAALPSTGELDFDPCSGCSAPCLKACPAGTYSEAGKSELARCADHRQAGGCFEGCEVRRACPIGRDHAFAPEHEQLRQAQKLSWMRRTFGLGIWRWVPASLRRRI